ncbi:MAG: hypothetical protein Q8S71_03785 [Hydrogenophaga sp.]|nr:hypothetical protein [Hydrogenophaga sp.]
MTQATDMLDKYIAAEQAILEGKSISFSGRTLSFENLQEIRAGRKEWEARVKSEQTTAANRSRNIGGLGVSVARFDQ